MLLTKHRSIFTRFTGSPVLKHVTWKTTRALQNDAGSLVRKITGEFAIVNGFDTETYAYEGEYPHQRMVAVHQEQNLESLRTMLAALAERGVDTEALVVKNYKRAVKETSTVLWDGELR